MKQLPVDNTNYREVALKYLNLLPSVRNLSDSQKEEFLTLCEVHKLNPFKREIYPIPRGGQLTIVTGYEVYLKRAELSGKLDGWEVHFGEENGEMFAECVVYRKDWNRPLVHRVWFSEYRGNSPLWREKPRTMLRKVAISQAFRLAFPVELGGMPYSPEELSEVEVVELSSQSQTTPQPQPVPQIQNKLEEKKKKKEVLKILSQILPPEERGKEEVRALGEAFKEWVERKGGNIEEVIEEILEKRDNSLFIREFREEWEKIMGVGDE